MNCFIFPAVGYMSWGVAVVGIITSQSVLLMCVDIIISSLSFIINNYIFFESCNKEYNTEGVKKGVFQFEFLLCLLQTASVVRPTTIAMLQRSSILMAAAWRDRLCTSNRFNIFCGFTINSLSLFALRFHELLHLRTWWSTFVYVS